MRVHFYYLNINSGLAYGNSIGILAAVLKKAGHEVSARALTNPGDLNFIEEDIKLYNPEVIGLSVVTNQAKYVPEIVSEIKKNSSAIVIAGGIHATIAPLDLKDKGIDYVFQGEAENSLLEFITRLENKQDISRIRGVWPNPPAELVDLTKIPQEDKEILKFSEITKKKNMWAGEIIATRGCPYECSYCCNSTLNNFYRKNLGVKTCDILRRRPVEHVIDELKELQENYPGIKMIILGDDTFTLNKEYCLELLRKYKENIKIPFVCNVNLLSFDEDIAKALKDAGCYEIKIGIESGSERIRRDILKRFITNEQILEKTKIAHNAGLNISTFNMIGLPTETESELKETVRLNAKIKPRRMKFMIFYPYPLTPAREICEKLRLIDYEKLAKLDNYDTDTPLKFDDNYMKTFYRIRDNLVVEVNNILGEEYYNVLSNMNVKGMIVAKEKKLE